MKMIEGILNLTSKTILLQSYLQFIFQENQSSHLKAPFGSSSSVKTSGEISKIAKGSVLDVFVDIEQNSNLGKSFSTTQRYKTHYDLYTTRLAHGFYVLSNMQFSNKCTITTTLLMNTE